MASKAQIIDFLLAGYRTEATDTPLNAGTVTVTVAGTANVAYVWDDRDKTLPTVTGRSTVTLDAYGKAEVYGDALYKFVIKDSAGSEVETIDYAEYSSLAAATLNDQVADYTALRATDITAATDGDQLIVAYRTTLNDGGGGIFFWDSSDLSTEVTADTASGINVAPDSDATGSSGSWVRQYGNAVLPAWFGAAGDGVADDTAVWTAMDALFPNGAVFHAPDTYAVDSVDFLGDNTTVDMRGTGTFLYNGSDTALLCLVIKFSGDDSKLLNGEVTNQALWDATNSTIVGNGASVQIAGTRFQAESVTLNNVPRIGFSFVDAGDGIINKCRIYGNFVEGSYTGVETVLFGISYNPPTAPTLAGLTVSDCIINTCVQGVFIGNYGAANKISDNVVISNNRIDNCWNHGVYNAGVVNGVVVDGNSFERCQIPVSMTGIYCIISNNSMKTDATGGQGDITGISLRDPTGCIVSGNTLVGDAPVGSTMIDLRGVFETELRGNIITGNRIKTSGGSSTGIAIGADGGTACKSTDNIIANNIVDCIGRDDVGLIFVNGLIADYGDFNTISGNTVIVRGNNDGIQTSYLNYTVVENNLIVFKANLAAPNTLGSIVFSNSSYGKVSNNRTVVPATFGTNITLRGLWEVATCVGNYYNFNDVVDNGALTALTQLVLISAGGAIINERGAGAPNVACSPGSVWYRTDGGALTTLYVKETGTGTAGFVGK